MNDIKKFNTYEAETTGITETDFYKFIDLCHSFGKPNQIGMSVEGELIYEFKIADIGPMKVNEHIFGFSISGLAGTSSPYLSNTIWLSNSEHVKYEIRVADENGDSTAWLTYKNHKIVVSEAIR